MTANATSIDARRYFTLFTLFLPETGNMLNISIGIPRHLFDQLPSE
jgi:hypothetical protein